MEPIEIGLFVKALIIDNYDSFSYNLLQLIGTATGQSPLIRRNDEIELGEILDLGVDCVILSPGPGRPDQERDFGVCRDVLSFGGLPVLGVCLGHQGIGLQAGARLMLAPEPMHGRVSRILHDGRALFEGIPSPFEAVRYHSLVLPDTLPSCLRVTAQSEDGLVAGIEHAEYPFWGVQFHPESILTEHGDTLISNFFRLAQRHSQRHPETITSDKRSTAEPNRVPEPSASEFLKVLSRRVETRLDDEQIFARLYQESHASFWLDTSRAIEGYSRYSYMGDASGPRAKLLLYDLESRKLAIQSGGESEQINCSIFDYLRHRLAGTRVEEVDLPFEFRGGWVGFLGYELKALCGADEVHYGTGHDAGFILADRFVAIDQLERAVWLVHLTTDDTHADATNWLDDVEQRLGKPEDAIADPFTDPRTDPRTDPITDNPTPVGAPVVFTPRHGRSEYLNRIHEAQTEIRRGESYEVCLTNEIRCSQKPDPVRLYQQLRALNPAPYAAMLRFPELTVLCSSPERFMKIDRDGTIEAKPIKGTAPRGQSPKEDQEWARWLASSEKDRSENLMIVDLLRNDLGKVCEIGSVQVPKLMEIESYQTVHQMVSTVRGRLLPQHRPVDAVVAAFPGGSMTGAPKIRTMEIIDRLEEGSRGVYSGAIGYFGLDGSVDLNIVIRTVVIDADGLSIGCGGAITHLSDPEAEYQEMRLKALAPMRAVATACGASEDDWILLYEDDCSLASQIDVPGDEVLGESQAVRAELIED